MSLSDSDREIITTELDREPTRAEATLFENLWSEHCAYRSSRPLLGAFESEGEQVVVGPGDDAAVVALPDTETGEPSETYVTLGIESHNHPSYVDPYDGAATGIGGIVRDTLSMGAYPIALMDSLYFGGFDRDHTRYLLEGVVEGISDYGNAIGVPTVGGSLAFHPDYEGNPLVNVACVGLLSEERLVTAAAKRAGNKLVLVGNATGRDGLGGASFASEDLAEDAETEDRPAVQVGDPYTEKLLIEANETLIDEGLIESARDLGAAGLGGASSELVAKGGLGARIDLERVHQREPNMTAVEVLLAESQERMCYEVRPESVERVRAVADRFDLGCSVIGEVAEGNYVCEFDGETVVDVAPELLADGAPMNDLAYVEPADPERDLPEIDLQDAFEAVVSSPNTASKEWVYRQYDHEVGLRTAVKPGDDAAVLAIREGTDRPDGANRGPGTGLAISAGADPNWTAADPYEGARAIAVENATNLAAKGATPLAAVDCLNGANPEKPEVYGGFRAIVSGLADACSDLSVPVVGGNVSLYNDSATGPIPPTPTLAMVGARAGYDAPPTRLAGEGALLAVGDPVLAGDVAPELGGSELLARFGGSDRFPAPAEGAPAFVGALAEVAEDEGTLAVHDASHGGLAVTLAEMVGEAGARVDLSGGPALGRLFHERVGRAVIETTDPEGVHERVAGVAPVVEIGEATADGVLEIETDTGELTSSAAEIADLRDVLARELD
ncbi:phosphoribosylformylglycinamidine synthase subunit PurL [Halalkalicoccus jeotgali]|uniref:Phosphoribosylformylglycinamidine synthase subunit PurL n=1 Tax=Halalkalicoccus jeotgali (strain DSM 18796 / CECT 7217 / JCM 14584 / KCTC 4019 / B3) TaxID=795797 RepID=D8J2D5_HALJB|nr:phosphoribosylformylglycinamidine synthase subunit PurL [Halalkalicoccus jeotgali]ADJ14892.1 phosphoribosylformylglycinamidine synthase II [Halalkalicoccus jeotgali B3]ELY39474.1 phosphoribosylformylglycinamidine synthase II [Halalkalicoccus jeotgali B3]